MTRPRREARARKAALVLPDKEWFKIGEAAALVGVEPYVLRYWEREFPREVRPERSAAGQRVYRKSDVEALFRIRALRYDERLDVKGAKRRLRQGRGGVPSAGAAELAAALRDELRGLLKVIDDDERVE